jgi:hypothetical protein
LKNSSTSRRTLRRALIAAGGLILGAAGSAAIVLAVSGGPAADPAAGPAAGPSGSPTASGTPTPRPSAPAEAEAPSGDTLEQDTAEIVLAEYFDTVGTLSAPDDLEVASAVATGAALDEIESRLLEFEVQEWTLRGDTRLEDVTVLESDLDGTPPTATVSVCVDSSDVELLNTDGSAVPKVEGVSRRAINIYTLAFADDAWRVLDHTFPDDPTC